jgi:CRP-like cAMP-binding protein
MEVENYEETMATRVALHPFLAGLKREHLVLLADCAISARFHPGDVILSAGGRADRFFLIETGKVVLESGQAHGEPVIIDTIGAGDLLGWSWMFPPYTWQFEARAAAPTQVIFFAGPVLREYCEREHSLGYALMKRLSAVMTRRMQNARRGMLGVHSRQVLLKPLVLPSPFMDQELDVPSMQL